jgi:succinate dehydrogenase (ubiquinone) membrane anchor subunit
MEKRSWSSLHTDPELTLKAILDGVLAVSLIIHSHIGFDACIADYVHERKFSFLGPLCTWLLRAGTGLAVWGVYEFNTNDIGES